MKEHFERNKYLLLVSTTLNLLSHSIRLLGCNTGLRCSLFHSPFIPVPALSYLVLTQMRADTLLAVLYDSAGQE